MLRIFTYIFALIGLIGARHSDRKKLASHLVWSTFLMFLTFFYFIYMLYVDMNELWLVVGSAVATLAQAVGIRKLRRYIESIIAFEHELVADVERQTIEATPVVQPTPVPGDQPQVVYVPVPQFYPAFNGNGDQQTPQFLPFFPGAFPPNSFPMFPAQGQVTPVYATQNPESKQ